MTPEQESEMIMLLALRDEVRVFIAACDSDPVYQRGGSVPCDAMDRLVAALEASNEATSLTPNILHGLCELVTVAVLEGWPREDDEVKAIRWLEGVTAATNAPWKKPAMYGDACPGRIDA